MNSIFSMFEHKAIVNSICKQSEFSQGKVVLKQFPDGESYLQFQTEIKDTVVWLVDSLDRPDEKIMPVILFAETARALGAKQVNLVTPYLPYMRQDTVFKPGEAVNARIFAKLISQYFDGLVTVDPHLHRIKDLGEIYSIPTRVLSATGSMADWIKANVKKPLLIGPDEESAQWVEAIGKGVGAPWAILEKIRKSANDVEVSRPKEKLENYQNLTPVLIDDILSTGGTLIKATKALESLGFCEPVCVCVHAVYARGVQTDKLPKVVTCNTISHETNAIDIGPLIGETLWNY